MKIAILSGSPCKMGILENVESVENVDNSYKGDSSGNNKSTFCKCFFHSKMWIMWISYFFNRFSPILTTSPAPIVINRSPCEQFSDKNFSISLKDEK